jgi:hypothetical protein
MALELGEKGLEFNITYNLTSNLEIGGSYAYSNFKFDKFNESARGDLVSRDGNYIPFIPKNQYSIFTAYNLNGFKTESFYKEHFSDAIDAWIGNESVLDLRAGFYEKFYTLKRPYVTMKFLKNGKVVSHFAKAYRGEVLRQIAIHQPHDEKELGEIHFKGLHIHEIITQKLKREYVFTIID